RAPALRGAAVGPRHRGIALLIGRPPGPAVEVSHQRIDRSGWRLDHEAALDAELVGLCERQDEDDRKSGREDDGDDGNGFQHPELLSTRSRRTARAEADIEAGKFRGRARPPALCGLGLLPRRACLAVPDQTVDMHADMRRLGRGIGERDGTVESDAGLFMAADLHQ
ncbi:hypothetical protein KXV85_004308, partial [Aspergillus fumigatus]